MPSQRRSPHTGLNVDLHPVRVRLCSRVRDLRSPHASFARAPCARSLSSARFVCALCAYTDAQMAAQVMVGGTGRTRRFSRLCVVARSVGAAAAAGSSYARVRPCASVRAFVCAQVMSAATPPTGTCAPRGAERARQATRARPTDARRAIFVRVSCHVDDWPYHGPSSSPRSPACEHAGAPRKNQWRPAKPRSRRPCLRRHQTAPNRSRSAEISRGDSGRVAPPARARDPRPATGIRAASRLCSAISVRRARARAVGRAARRELAAARPGRAGTCAARGERRRTRAAPGRADRAPRRSCPPARRIASRAVRRVPRARRARAAAEAAVGRGTGRAATAGRRRSRWGAPVRARHRAARCRLSVPAMETSACYPPI